MSQLLSAYENKREQMIFKLRKRSIQESNGKKLTDLTLTELIGVWRWSEKMKKGK
ncbi:hypothetical protein [Alkalihalophilus pseudofirmus]|uniref:hypothetical protein n=1 Tax=Alkalihalophilus pseudofirmus TaxID=79885 RepID=UPI00158A8E54